MKINFFPVEPSARVKYSMAVVNNFLNQMSTSPTREKPLIIRGLNAVQMRYIWTALMVWGKNHPTLTFSFNEIKILNDHIFHPGQEYQIGLLWSDFTPTSLYKTEFKHYLTPNMLIPVEYPQAFEDVPVSLYKTIEEQEQFKIEEAQNPEEAWLKKEAKIKKEALKHENDNLQEQTGTLESGIKEISLQQEKGKQTKVSSLLFFEKANEIPSLNRLRTMVLCEAIESYLSWRNNKNGANKRGYNVTSITWLWHYTVFGENRAKQLMQQLLVSPDDCLNTLKKHFSDYFSINNHSLDTYLLEAIWETNVLFPIYVELPNLGTITARKQLLDVILTTDMLSAPENQDTLVPCIVTYLFSELHIAHKDAIPDYLALCHQYQRREDAD
ncbi:hypothetical protein, partial [Legionella sp.]|uniref:hypothetical protein n=1 Tax=Legionella sp. TaxID=459 RepID=UPI003D0E855E